MRPVATKKRFQNGRYTGSGAGSASGGRIRRFLWPPLAPVCPHGTARPGWGQWGPLQRVWSTTYSPPAAVRWHPSKGVPERLPGDAICGRCRGQPAALGGGSGRQVSTRYVCVVIRPSRPPDGAPRLKPGPRTHPGCAPGAAAVASIRRGWPRPTGLHGEFGGSNGDTIAYGHVALAIFSSKSCEGVV